MKRPISQLHAIAISLAMTCALPGCCQLQNVANSFSHWGETRVDCELPETCTPGCPTNCVTLLPPEGYLSEGPTFVGDTITGPAAKTSLDRMVELDEELGSLRKENEQLVQRIEVAEQTIQDQGRAIDTAGQELQRALRDYNQVRSQLEKWNGELDSVNGQVRHTFQQHQRTLNQFEDELEDILSEFDPALRTSTQRSRRGPTPAQQTENMPRLRPADLRPTTAAPPAAALADPQIESLPIGELRSQGEARLPEQSPIPMRWEESEQPTEFQLRESQAFERIQFGPPIFGPPAPIVPSRSSSNEHNSDEALSAESNDVSLVPPRNLYR